MQIDRATSEDFQELRVLWSVVFNEEPEFLEHFFAQRYQPDYIVVARKDGEIVSALHALPSTYMQNNKEQECAFIVGAATYAMHRKQGIMGQLLAYTKATTPYPITLFPAVRPFYEANGYITTSYMEEYWLAQLENPQKNIIENRQQTTQTIPHYSLLDRIYREANHEGGALMRDSLGWNFLLDGYQVSAVEGAYAFIKDGIAVEAMALDTQSAKELITLLQTQQVERIRVIPNSPFASLLEGPFVQIPMGMSTDPSMRGVYIAEQY